VPYICSKYITMPLIAIQHTHMWIAILFLGSYLYKTALFFGSDKDKFEKYRKATLIPENVLATIFLLTGFYLVWQKSAFSNEQYVPWFHIKFTLAIVAIPIGIVGFKKSNKMLVAISALMFIAVLLLALINGTSGYL